MHTAEGFTMPLRSMGGTRVGIGHALVDNCSYQEACSSIIRYVQRRGKPAYVITPNAQHIVLLNKDKRFQEAYRHADLIIADGVSLLYAARLHGRELKERIPGVDIFHDLCGLAAASGLRVFLLGGQPGSAERAADALRKEFPALQASVYWPPAGFEKSAEGLGAAANAVRAAHPDLLFVALGAPKQENWIYEQGLKLSVPVCIGVGGSFEMVGGLVPRAPRWVRDISCEWFYRLCCEPRRLWRRYLIGNLEFAVIVLRQLLRRALLNMVVERAARASLPPSCSSFPCNSTRSQLRPRLR